jgi:hypothetical protein
MKPLTYFVDLPSIHALQNRYGNQLQQLSVETRLHIMATLACAAAAVEQDGITERIDIALLNVYPSATAELLEYLRALDAELGSWGEATALVGAISSSLAYASV